MNSSNLRIWISLLSVALLAGCASAPEKSDNDNENQAEITTSQVYDPFEGFNRSMWAINYDYLDPYLVRPVSLAYVNYIPSPIRTGVANVLGNLDEPSSMVNNLLMGNGRQALDNFNRFWINTGFGIFGIFDIATAAGIKDQDDRAFSDAVGHYGVGNGPYVMVPGYGPWTVRESVDVVDGLYVPLSYLNIWAGIGKWALEGMETRAALVNQEAQLENSPDPYVLTRDVYLQRQDFKAEVTGDDYDEQEEAYLDEYLEDL